MSTTLRAPFPYFGGKRGAAPKIWNLLGLARPTNHRYQRETVNVLVNGAPL